MIIGGRHYSESDRRRARRDATPVTAAPDVDVRMRGDSQPPGLGLPGDVIDNARAFSPPTRARDDIDLDMALRYARPRTGQRHDSAT